MYRLRYMAASNGILYTSEAMSYSAALSIGESYAVSRKKQCKALQLIDNNGTVVKEWGKN